MRIPESLRIKNNASSTGLPGRKRISACWIAKNEASNIGLSIRSVMDIADELIVVDTGSTDKTVEIAQSLGARVEFFEWINDFAAARNHALSFATGDIIIFLDADEWFAPRLGPTDLDHILDVFRTTQAEVIWTQLNNIEKQTGKFMGSAIVTCIFLNRENMRFIGKVHEFLDPSARSKDAKVTDILHINHSGYSKDIMMGKAERNIEMLKSGFSASEPGSIDRVRFLVYLIRECSNRSEFDVIPGYLTELLKQPDELKKVCRYHGEAFVIAFYPTLWVMHKLRSSISRKIVHRNIFELFKSMYPDYPGTAQMDILYQLYFDFKEGRFLKEFDAAVDSAHSKQSQISTYKDYEPLLYKTAAYAALRRREYDRAKEYAVFILKEAEANIDLMGRTLEPLLVLMNTLRGQQPADVIVFLSGIFNISEKNTLDYLISGTAMEGFREVHSYFIKKRMDAGEAYIVEQMKFLLINKLYDALIPIAVEAYVAGDTDAAWCLFIAAVCGAPREVIEECADMLEEYAEVLYAYYKGERLEEISESHKRILTSTYDTVAFVIGLEAADNYLSVFRADPTLCFLTKALYCEKNALFDELLDENMDAIAPLNYACRQYVIQSFVLAGRYDEALAEIETFLNAENMESNLFNMLSVVGEKAAGDTGARARRLYSTYMSLHDLIIDLADVVNTGVILDGGGKKQNQFFKSMTCGQFDKYLAEEAERPIVRALPRLLKAAAEIYNKNGAPAEAARCLWRLIAHKQAEKADYEALADIFADLKNAKLPAHIRGMIS